MDECLGIVGPNGECTGGGGDGGYDYPGGGDPEPEDPKTPCDKTKGILTNPEVQAKIDDLKTKSTGTLENAYKFKADGTPSNLIVGNAHSVNFGDKTGYQGGYHNHTTGTEIFSPADIEQLLQFALVQGNYGNPSNAYVGMVASNGMHYVIQFNGNYNDALVSYSQEDLDAYAIRYQTRYGMISSNNSIGNEAIERFFFKTVRDMGLDDKIILQRIENDGIIKAISRNNDGSINAVPCI